MAPSRAYIPSPALLRALSRPIAPRCLFSHHRPPPVRSIRTQANAPQRPTLTRKQLEKNLGAFSAQEPPTDHDLGGVGKSRIESIEWYQQDDAGNERLVERIANAQDLERLNKQEEMFEMAQNDPNYDTSDLYRASISNLLANPNFADLRDQLEDMRKGALTSAEKEIERQKAEKEAAADVRMDIHNSLQELIDDPDMADEKADLQEMQKRLPEFDSLSDNPEWQALLEKLEDKLEKNEAYQEKMASKYAEAGLDPEQGSGPSQEFLEKAKDWRFDKPEEVNALMKEMQGLLTAMGADPALEKELEDIRNEDPIEDMISEDEDKRAEMTFESLSQELSRLKDSPPPEELDYDKVGPEIQAKVDKILEDPNLMEKLAVIKELLVKSRSDVTMMGESAPDPQQLDPSETTTLDTRLKIAENDPEHIAALRRLRINLLPPFHVSPALRSLNEALKLSYIGANDDVRRVLWRAYSKARSIPTLLQNIPDDAWDMLWYSQAVTWGSNQNRQNHLKILLQDLTSVGKDGPPTHPQTLADEELMD